MQSQEALIQALVASTAAVQTRQPQQAQSSTALSPLDISATPTPPPSHLSAFPPPAGNLSLQAALASLRSAEVSPAPHSTTINNIQSGHSTFHVGPPPPLPGAGTSAPARPTDMFSNLPTALTPACPAEAKKKATTPKELDSQLGAWIGGNEAIRADPDTFHAWSSFVRTTVGFAHTVGMAAALAYNEESLRAAMRAPSLYNPVQHGDVYEPAHSHHIQPVLNFRARPGPARKQWQPRAGGSDSTSSPVKPSRGKRRRQATTPDSPQSPRRSGSSHCAIHGQCGHSTADCHTIKALKKQKTDKSDKKEQAAAASSSP
jgi:hypothetical protein